jgi:hypothetical protein
MWGHSKRLYICNMVLRKLMLFKGAAHNAVNCTAMFDSVATHSCIREDLAIKLGGYTSEEFSAGTADKS